MIHPMGASRPRPTQPKNSKSIMQKRVIQRNLPLSDKYVVASITHGSLISGDGCVCDNCNALISNVATIKSDAGKAFYVGLDCMKTLTLKPDSMTQELLESYNSFTAFLQVCNKPDAVFTTQTCGNGCMVFVKALRPNGRMQYTSLPSASIEQFMPYSAFQARFNL